MFFKKENQTSEDEEATNAKRCPNYQKCKGVGNFRNKGGKVYARNHRSLNWCPLKNTSERIGDKYVSNLMVKNSKELTSLNENIIDLRTQISKLKDENFNLKNNEVFGKVTIYYQYSN